MAKAPTLRLAAHVAAAASLIATGAVAAPARTRTPAPAPAKPAAKPAKRAAAPKPGALPFVPAFDLSALGLPSVSVDRKGVTAKAGEDGPTLAIGGRIHLDASAARLRPSSLGPALTDDTEIRRAWIEPTLTLPNGLVANLQYDFSSANQPVNNALVAYRGFERVIVTVGNVKEPFSLDQLISNNNTLFTERSLLDIFAPGRDVGGAVGASGARWTMVAGVFGGNINTNTARDGVAGTARVTWAPILTDEEVLHVGLAGSYRALDPDGSPLSFDVGPENDLAARSFAATGPLRGAADVARLGVEALYQWGAARVQAEYALASVGGRDGQQARLFQAGYVQAAWVFNGEGPRYALAPSYGTEFAVLGGVKVPDGQRLSDGGIGVFELGARLSAVSLESGGTAGGREVDASLGLNWYPDNNIRVMADYVRAHAEPAARAVAAGGNADSDSVIGRLQFFW